MQTNEDKLEAVLECSDSDLDTFYYPWNLSPASLVCDPIPLITLTGRQNKALKLWSLAEKAEDQEFPELVSAYLVADVLQASIKAVMLLKYYYIAPFVPKGFEGSAPNERTVKQRPLRRKTNELAETLLEMLVIYHHRSRKGAIIREPLGQKACCEKMGWKYPRDQPKLSRLMKDIFLPRRKPGQKKRSDAMQAYRRLCRKGEIEDHWRKREMAAVQERVGIKGEPEDLQAKLVRDILGI